MLQHRKCLQVGISSTRVAMATGPSCPPGFFVLCFHGNPCHWWSFSPKLCHILCPQGMCFYSLPGIARVFFFLPGSGEKKWRCLVSALALVKVKPFWLLSWDRLTEPPPCSKRLWLASLQFAECTLDQEAGMLISSLCLGLCVCVCAAL